jgi:hypothetical protein
VAEDCFALINAKSDTKFELNYLQIYIGLRYGGHSSAFIAFFQRKAGASVEASVEDPESWAQRFQEADFK